MDRRDSLLARLDGLLDDPLVRAMMAADHVDEDDLRDMLEDLAQRRRLNMHIRPGIVPGSLSICRQSDSGSHGVGVILLDRVGRVFAGQCISSTPVMRREHAWQPPQGRIAAGEAPVDAALRTLQDTIGTANAEILAESRGWIRYDLPPPLWCKVDGRYLVGHEQKWFVLRFLGIDADINVATSFPTFDAWRWTEPGQLGELLIHLKRHLYRSLMEEFASVLSTGAGTREACEVVPFPDLAKRATHQDRAETTRQ